MRRPARCRGCGWLSLPKSSASAISAGEAAFPLLARALPLRRSTQARCGAQVATRACLRTETYRTGSVRKVEARRVYSCRADLPAQRLASSVFRRRNKLATRRSARPYVPAPARHLSTER